MVLVGGNVGERMTELVPTMAKRQKVEASAKTPTTPELHFSGKVVCISDAASVAESVDALLANSADSTSSTRALGFDIEWRATFERGVPQRPAATLQLASDDLAVVFQLSQIGSLSEPLACLLNRSDVLKVGVGSIGDARKLTRDYGAFKCAGESSSGGNSDENVNALTDLLASCGVLDLNELARYAIDIGHSRSSLTSLCDELLGAHVPKPQGVRMGDWEACPLSEAQLNYAALDAWAGLRLFQAMTARSPTSLDELRAGLVRMPSRCASDTDVDRPAEWMPAEDGVKLLPPSKQQVYTLFSNGHSANSIAETRFIQLTTVHSYLADAMAAGYAYDWSRFCIPSEDEEAILSAVAANPEAGIKVIKEALPEHIAYSSIKLVQLHRARKDRCVVSQPLEPVASNGAGDAVTPEDA